jgi:hypothetical protein
LIFRAVERKERHMKRLPLVLMLAIAPVATAGATTFSGTWRPLPKAPITPNNGGLASVWTGKQVLVFGRAATIKQGAAFNRVNVAAAYDPARKTWRRLSPPKPTPSFMDNDAVWTGKEMSCGARARGSATTRARTAGGACPARRSSRSTTATGSSSGPVAR